MPEFFDNYFNLKKILKEKREYKQQAARIEALPEDYRYVFKKMQEYMWRFATGAGYDMMKLHYDLIDLFEAGVAEGKPVLEITGEDIAAFCDELIRSVNTWPENWRTSFNEEIHKKLKNKEKE